MVDQFVDLETRADAPGATQTTVGQPNSHNGWQGATCCPLPQRTPAAMSAPAQEKRAPDWEERTQPRNWEQGRNTHCGEASPNRRQSNAQGDHEVRATKKPPNAADAERAISNQAPPSLHEVPANSTRVGAAPHALGGARHGGGNRAMTSQLRVGQSTSCGDVQSSWGGGGAGRWDRSGCAQGAPRSANGHGKEQHSRTECGSHTRRDEGKCSG